MEKYEIKDVTASVQVEKGYNDAVANNYKYYRAISAKGNVYGWNAKERKLFKDGIGSVTVDGEIWYLNEQYIEPIEEVEIPEIPEEIVEETPVEVEEVVEEAVTAEVVIPEVEIVAVDYQALYKNAIEEAGAFGEQLAEKDKQIEFAEAKYAKLEAEFAEYKSIVDKFFSLKGE